MGPTASCAGSGRNRRRARIHRFGDLYVILNRACRPRRHRPPRRRYRDAHPEGTRGLAPHRSAIGPARHRPRRLGGVRSGLGRRSPTRSFRTSARAGTDGPSSRAQRDDRARTVANALAPDESKGDRGRLADESIVENRRCLVDVDHDAVDVPVAVQVSEGGRPTRRLARHGVPGGPLDLGESADPVVPEDLIGLAVAGGEVRLVHARIGRVPFATKTSRSPSLSKSTMRVPQPRENHDGPCRVGLADRVGEEAASVIDVGVVGLVGEVRHEEIEGGRRRSDPPCPRPCPPGGCLPSTAPRPREKTTPRNAPSRRSGRGSSALSRWRRRDPESPSPS